MPRFSRSLLSDRELNSVIAYVQYTDSPDDRGGWSLGRLGPVPEGLVAWFVAGVVLVGVTLTVGRRIVRGALAAGSSPSRCGSSPAAPGTGSRQ